MSKKNLLALMLAVCLVFLTACSGQKQAEQFQVITDPQQLQNQASAPAASQSQPQQQSDTTAFDFDSGDYDPASEESYNDFDDDVSYSDSEGLSTEAIITAPPIIASQYAGATPVVLDPIDKPTPTPAPALSITEFQTYDATKLSLSFDGPVGWTVNDLAADTFVLTNPDGTVDYKAELIVRTMSVSAAYGELELKREVKQMLTNIKADYSSFSPSNTASRTLMDKKGIYADFSGTRKDTGAQVWGRVHITCINKTLIILQLTCPYVYRETYKDTVYSKFRHSVKFTR